MKHLALCHRAICLTQQNSDDTDVNMLYNGNFENGAKRIHYGDVIMGAVASQITKSRLLTQAFIRAQINENIKAPCHWPLCKEFTGDRLISRTKGQLRGKCFHLMTSSWTVNALRLTQMMQRTWPLTNQLDYNQLSQRTHGLPITNSEQLNIHWE